MCPRFKSLFPMVWTPCNLCGDFLKIFDTQKDGRSPKQSLWGLMYPLFFCSFYTNARVFLSFRCVLLFSGRTLSDWPGNNGIKYMFLTLPTNPLNLLVWYFYFFIEASKILCFFESSPALHANGFGRRGILGACCRHGEISSQKGTGRQL